MRWQWVMVVLTAALLYANDVVAEKWSIGWFYDLCRFTDAGDKDPESSPVGDLSLAFCLGYINGWFHAADANALVPEIGFCLKNKNVEADQLTAVFLKWAKDHPEQWHKHAYEGVIESWREAFPCTK